MAIELNTEAYDPGYFSTDYTGESLTSSANAATTTWIAVDPGTDYVLSGTFSRMRVQFKTALDVITYYSGSTNDPVSPETITTAIDTAYLRVYYGALSETLSVMEATGDPVLSDQIVSVVGETGATATVSTDTETGTLYAAVTTSASPPSSSDIKAGTGAAYSDSQSISSIGTKTFSATGLTTGASYYWHFIQTDTTLADSNIATTLVFSPTATIAVTLSSPPERGNINVTASNVIANTITIQPQIFDGSWCNFFFKITGANGTQPDFKCTWASYLYTSLEAAVSGGLFPRYSYTPDDVDSWIGCSSVSDGGTTMDWAFDEAFTGDVYVSIFPVVTPSMIHTWFTGLSGISEPASAISFGGDPYQYGVIPQVTDVNGRVIPAQKQYCFKFGTGAKTAVLFGGVHACEDLGSIMMMEAIGFLAGSSGAAIKAREDYTFWVYPMVNPQGRYGGHFRFTFETGFTTLDPNRDWIDGTGFDLVCTSNIRDAVTADVGAHTNIDFFADFHSKASSATIYAPGPTASTEELEFLNAVYRFQNNIAAWEVSPVTGTSLSYHNEAALRFTLECGHVDTRWDKAGLAKEIGYGLGAAISRSEWAIQTNTETGIDFGGDNSLRHYEIPSDTALGLTSSEWSIGFWFYSDDNSGSSGQYLYSMGVYGSANAVHILAREDGLSTNPGKMQVVLRDSANSYLNMYEEVGAGDSVKTFVLIQLRAGKLEFYTCTEAGEITLQGSLTYSIGTIEAGPLLIGGRDNDTELTRAFTEHAGGLFKADFALELPDIEQIAWGIAKPSSLGTLQLDLPMYAADAILTDESSNALVATRSGADWPTPSIGFLYPEQIYVDVYLSGGISCDAIAGGQLSVDKKLSGMASAVASVTGEIEELIVEAGIIYLSGMASAVASVTGEIEELIVEAGIIYLSGVASAVGSVSGSVDVIGNISGDVAAIAKAVGEFPPVGTAGLGVIINPTIEVLTARRII